MHAERDATDAQPKRVVVQMWPVVVLTPLVAGVARMAEKRWVQYQLNWARRAAWGPVDPKVPPPTWPYAVYWACLIVHRSVGDPHRRGTSSQALAELAVAHSGGELGPLGRGEDQDRAGPVPAVTQSCVSIPDPRSRTS